MDLLEKAARLGIETSFIDATGQRRTIDIGALTAVVESLSDKPKRHLLTVPPICRGGSRVYQELSDSARFPVCWEITGAHGARYAEGISSEGRLDLPTPPAGIFRLRAKDSAGREDDVSLLSVPRRAFGGNFDRIWILAVQLYSVRSDRNWGIGDFTDLKDLLAWAGQLGAGGIGLNPLHALFADQPEDCSPYSPNSRLFLNQLYIDVERLPELPASFAARNAAQLAELRSSEFVDYRRVADLKTEALRAAFLAFKAQATKQRREDFDDYRKEKGKRLSRFGCFESLRRKYRGPWWSWPDGCSFPADKTLEALRNGSDSSEIEFVEFVQWNAERQLGECFDRANELNLPLGLYLDIAVGVKADGFDAWNEQAAISRNLSVGAPPDLLNAGGQNWGLAGFNPVGLELQSYKPFYDVLEASMRYAGAVRLDHVLGLKRLYLVPAGYAPSQGAYIEMPFQSLLAITALASMANNCVVIGEDLGTVPDGFRSELEDWGIWSYRVMMFERGYDGTFNSVEHYPRDALVTFNTHDLPTFLGWTSGHDIGIRLSLGVDPGEDENARANAVKLLANALDQQQLSDTDFYSAISYLGKTRSRILCLSIEDLLNVKDQTNIPGTVHEYPNWRRRLPVSIEIWEQHIDTASLQRSLHDRAGGAQRGSGGET